MRAIFLNNLAEAELLEANGGCDAEDVVIPAGPDARFYAEQKEWPIRLIGDFFSDRMHEEGRDLADKAVGRVVVEINEYYGRRPGFPPVPLGDYFWFDFFIIVGQVLFTRQLLEAAAGRHPLKVYHDKNLRERSVFGIRPHPDGLVALVAEGLGKELCEIVPYESARATDQLTLRRRLRGMAPASLIDVAYWLKWWKIKAGRPAAWRGRKKRVLVLGGMFDWRPVVFTEEFMLRYVPTFKSLGTYPDEARCGKSVRDVTELIGRAVFPNQPDAFDFSPLARRIQAAAERLTREYGALERFVRKHDAVLASVFVTPFQHAAAHCALGAGKPVICYQHGEMNLYEEPFLGRFTEVANATHYFAYGKGVTPKYVPLIGNSPLKEVVVVGTTLKKPAYRGGRLVVYATGKWFKTARPYAPQPDPDARLYEAQRSIIRYLEGYAVRNPRDEVVVKANNTDLFNAIPFPAKVRIDYANKFTDLLGSAKLVILDAPGTTCLEAASTSVPLFILAGRARWHEEPLRLLKKRAVVEEGLEGLLAQLERFENAGAYPANPASREFSAAYGGEGDAGQAIEKALDHLNRIIDA